MIRLETSLKQDLFKIPFNSRSLSQNLYFQALPINCDQLKLWNVSRSASFETCLSVLAYKTLLEWKNKLNIVKHRQLPINTFNTLKYCIFILYK